MTMYYYKSIIEREEVVLNTEINHQNIVRLGSIVGFKIGERIFYKENAKFWYKDVNTDCDYPFEAIDNKVTGQPVGFFDGCIAVKDTTNGIPEIFTCKFYDYLGNELEHDNAPEIFEQTRIILLYMLIDHEKYREYYEAKNIHWMDRPSMEETFADNKGKPIIDYEYIMNLIHQIKSKRMLNEEAAEMMIQYSELFLLCGCKDFSVPFVNVMTLSGVSLNKSALIFHVKKPLHDKFLYNQVKNMVEQYDKKTILNAFKDFKELKELYNQVRKGEC